MKSKPFLFSHFTLTIPTLKFCSFQQCHSPNLHRFCCTDPLGPPGARPSLIEFLESDGPDLRAAMSLCDSPAEFLEST